MPSYARMRLTSCGTGISLSVWPRPSCEYLGVIQGEDDQVELQRELDLRGVCLASKNWTWLLADHAKANINCLIQWREWAANNHSKRQMHEYQAFLFSFRLVVYSIRWMCSEIPKKNALEHQ